MKFPQSYVLFDVFFKHWSLIICKNFAHLIVRLAVSLGTTERKELDRVSPSWIGFWFGSMACTVWTRADFPERTNANAHGAAAETEMARGAAAGRAAAQSVEWSRRPVPQSLLNSPQLINVLLCFVKHTHPKKKTNKKNEKNLNEPNQSADSVESDATN